MNVYVAIDGRRFESIPELRAAHAEYDYTAEAVAPVGSDEDTAHFCLDKAEVAIDTDQPDEARRLIRASIVAYSRIDNPIARANAANRQARLSARWMDRFFS